VPQVCTVCRHRKRGEIERGLVDGLSVRAVASQYGLTSSAVQRHRVEHLPRKLASAKAESEREDGRSLVDRIEELHRETRNILDSAVSGRSKDNTVALKAIARLEKQLELEGRLLGELREAPAVALIVSPEWIALRTAILGALDAYPDARQAVALAIEEGGGLNDGQGE
jgi:hypothetical protein